MTNRNYYGLEGTLTAAVSSGAVLLPIDSTSAAVISANFVNGSDESWFALRAGNVYELVKATAISGNILAVDRDQDGTGAKAFPAGTTLEFVVTAEGIIEELGGDPTGVSIDGLGLVVVENPAPGEFTVEVVSPTFTGANGIDVVGDWPAYTIVYTPPEDDCCGGGGGTGGDGIEFLEGTGIAEAWVDGATGNVYVPPPSFSGVGVEITGEWPNLLFTASAGGAGTVTSVTAGAGITVTGSPTVNPTVAITNTGVTAGAYGDITFNARGQATVIAATFNPISEIVAGDGISAVRTGGSVELDVDTAAIGVPGIAPLADPTDPFDPDDDTSIATPAVVAAALAAMPAVDAVGADSYIGAADGDYTNVISGSSVAINIAAGEKAVVYAEVTMVDGGAPATPVQFGLAVFNSSPAKVRSNANITQSNQSMMFILDGPVNSTLVIATTAVPGGAAVTSYSLAIVLI